jgi:hypothetical protein
MSTIHTLLGLTARKKRVWHDSNYAYRKLITIQDANVDSDETDFPVLIWAEADTDLNTGKVQADLDDIRFYDADGNALKYETVQATADGTDGHLRAYVKMNVYASPTGNQNKLYMYYGYGAAANGEDAANVWSNSFEAVWHMGDNGSQTDSTGNGHTLTAPGNAPDYQQTAHVHQGVTFDGANTEYLERDGTPPVTAAPVTVTALAYTTDATNAHPIFFVGDKDVGAEWYSLELGGATAGDPAQWRSKHPSSYVAESSTGYSSGQWHHYAGTENSTTLRAAFIDGGSKGTNTDTSPALVADRVSIGRYGDSSPSTYASATVEEIRVASVVRSDGWIKFEAKNFLEADHEQTWASEESR